MISRLREILARPDPALGYFNGDLRFWLGWAQEVAGDYVAAQQSWRQARSELESFLKEQPENEFLIQDLALINMGLGDKVAALALSERAIAANPVEKDALTGPIPLEIIARVAARTGEPDRAIAALQKLLLIPYAGVAGNIPLTPALLRLDPMFDPLRNDPALPKTRRRRSTKIGAEITRGNVNGRADCAPRPAAYDALRYCFGFGLVSSNCCSYLRTLILRGLTASLFLARALCDENSLINFCACLSRRCFPASGVPLAKSSLSPISSSTRARAEWISPARVLRWIPPVVADESKTFEVFPAISYRSVLPTCSIFLSGPSQKPSRTQAGNSNGARLKISRPCASKAGKELTYNRIWTRLLK